MSFRIKAFAYAESWQDQPFFLDPLEPWRPYNKSWRIRRWQWRSGGKEDEMLKYRRNARIALAVELLGFPSGCWQCVGHRNDGEFMEVEDDSSKIKDLN